MPIAPPLAQTSQFHHFSCPDCQGALEPVRDSASGTVAYLCRIGHRYDARELLVGKEVSIEHQLWATLTSIDELVTLLAELDERGDPAGRSSDYRHRYQIAVAQRVALEQVIAQNEPVHVDVEDIPLETTRLARLRRREG